MSTGQSVKALSANTADPRQCDRDGIALSRPSATTALQKELLRWALRYAEQSLPVFPVGGNKIPLVKWKATGGSTDASLVRAWWSRWPLAMIAMPTGKRSGLIVLDIDRKNGVDGFATMRAMGWTLPAGAVEVVTPSGGSHFYFRAPSQVEVRNSAGRLGPGLDIRGEGGMVILPPSRPSLDSADYAYAEGQDLELGRLQ